MLMKVDELQNSTNIVNILSQKNRLFLLFMVNYHNYEGKVSIFEDLLSKIIVKLDKII